MEGEVELPGSKSISNRLLVIEALAGKEMVKWNLSDSSDTTTLLDILKNPTPEINAGEGGTTFRFLLSYLAFKKGEWILTGSMRAKERPISELVTALRALGAEIEYLERENHLPVKIFGGYLKGGKIKLYQNITSQFVSSLLLVAPCMDDGLVIETPTYIVSSPYIEMTLKMLKFFGIDYIRRQYTLIVFPSEFRLKPYKVETDWSSAAFYYEMMALAEKGDLNLKGLKLQSIQGDERLKVVYSSLGVLSSAGEKSVHLTKSNSTSSYFDMDFRDYPDIFPSVVLTCAALGIDAKMTGIEHLQYKESNRLAVIQQVLEQMGVVLKKNGLEYYLQGKINNGNYIVPTFNDHRMAMAFASLVMQLGEITLEDPDVVKKSYPNFWNDLEKLGFEVGYSE